MVQAVPASVPVAPRVLAPAPVLPTRISTPLSAVSAPVTHVPTPAPVVPVPVPASPCPTPVPDVIIEDIHMEEPATDANVCMCSLFGAFHLLALSQMSQPLEIDQDMNIVGLEASATAPQVRTYIIYCLPI